MFIASFRWIECRLHLSAMHCSKSNEITARYALFIVFWFCAIRTHLVKTSILVFGADQNGRNAQQLILTLAVFKASANSLADLKINFGYIVVEIGSYQLQYAIVFPGNA